MRLLHAKPAKADFDHLVVHPASSGRRPTNHPGVRSPPARRQFGNPIHPLLAEVLAGNLGIMVYQEDVSRVAMALAGMSSDTEADGLRKIISKKDRELKSLTFVTALSAEPPPGALLRRQVGAVGDDA